MRMTRKNLKLMFMLGRADALKSLTDPRMNTNSEAYRTCKAVLDTWDRVIALMDEPDPEGFSVTNADEIRCMDDEELFKEICRLIENAMACPVCWNRTGRAGLRLHLETEAIKERTSPEA